MSGIIPQPSKHEIGNAELSLARTLRIGTGIGDAVLAAESAVKIGNKIVNGGLRFVVDPDSDDPEIILDVESECHEEGYRLCISENGIRISARTRAGWFYGLQTLWQLLRESPESIGKQEIVDTPRFSWRGLHLDVCRHFFDVNFIKRLLDLMAIHKLNRFHWHLTEDQGWRIDVPEFPRLREVSAWRDENGTRYGGIYTHSEMKEVVDYAAARCITVVPEIELPGHSLAALAAYPELGCESGPFKVATEWGIFPDVFCAGNDQVFDFLKSVLRTTMDLFPGRYLHIGGDECPKTRWVSCPKCLHRIQNERLDNEDQLQSWFVGQIISFLKEHGKQAIGWDEILEGGLLPGAMVMSWRGMEGGIAAARLGHDVIMTPTTHCYFDYRQHDANEEPGFHGVTTLREVYEFNPIPAELDSEQARHVVGAQANVWTERMLAPEDVEFMILPRLCALSEVVWSPQEDRQWQEFEDRVGPHLEMLRGLGYRPRALA